MPNQPAKKRASAKSTKSPKKRTAAKKTAAKKSGAKKSTSAARKAKPAAGEGETLHNVARSIGATLGSFAKTTSDALKAAKQALPSLKHSEKRSE